MRACWRFLILLACGGFSAPAADRFRPPASDVAWLEGVTAELLNGCRVRADDGTWLYTPDGKGNYRALWTRDFAYMVEHAGHLMPPGDIEAAITYLLRGMRSDGATPDRVQPDGVAVYAGGGVGHPLGEPNLDNGPFLVIAVDAYLARLPEAEARRRFVGWAESLERGLDWVPRSASGLVWNDPARPHSPYGFTDTVGKTGELLFESVLYWVACEKMSKWERSTGRHERARVFRDRARAVERNLAPRLWDGDAGAFWAATQDCRQWDVWGNAYLLWVDFPLGRKRSAVVRWLTRNRDQYLWRGQVRHLLRGQYWDRLLAPVEKERYQNGAYWATASGWVIDALARTDRGVAAEVWNELMADFRSGGVCECVNDGYRQLPSYVVSAANPLGLSRPRR